LAAVKAPVALLVAAYACLFAAWILGNPPFSAPDEPAHFVRAAAIAHGGTLAGAEPDYPPRPAARAGAELVPPVMLFGPPQRSWNRKITRTVRIPNALVPRVFACNTFFTFLPLDCHPPPLGDPARVVSVRTYAGSFPPLPHMIAAAGAALAPERADPAVRAARAALALVCLGFLAIALLALAPGGLLSLAGVAVAVTPMAVFLCSSVTSTGLTIAASAAFLACVFRATRDGAQPRWLAPAAALAGAVVCLSRSEGPAWLALDLLALVALPAELSLRSVFRRREWIAGAGAVVVAFVLNRVWDGLYAPHFDFSLGVARDALRHEHASFLGGLFHQVIGSFGWLDTPVPRALAVVWGALLALFVVLALATVTRARRPRVLLFLAVIAVVPHLFTIVLWEIGRWDADGRYVLPVIPALALFAGEVVFRQADRLPPRLARLLGPAALGSVGLLQLWAWWWNARRQATGDHASLWFLSHPVWSPPTGWALPVALAVAGTAAMVAVAVHGSIRNASAHVGGAPPDDSGASRS
jgi:hypothetical protein